MKLSEVLLALLLAAPAGAASVSEEAAFFDLERSSLEDMLNVRTGAASRSLSGLRESPGLVAVITRDEIQASGARDLVDVLRGVPELEFGVDVQGNLGLGVRGNWANEGKVLLLWDGQEYNEPLYSTIQFDRFSVDQVEEIEIVKGPGSALYGGFAELAVINVRTRSAKGLKGTELFAAAGRRRGAAGVNFTRKFGGRELSAKAFWGESARGAGRYRDFAGNSYALESNSSLRPRNLNLAAASVNGSLRLIIDDYGHRYRDGIDGGALSTGPAKVQFPSVHLEGRRFLRLGEDLRLEPRVALYRGMPWLEKDEHFTYDKKVSRVTAGLIAAWRASDAAEFLAGGEYFHDSVRVDAITATSSQYAAGRDEAQYDNHAFFAQAAVKTDPVNLTAGARYEKHSQYGSALVPRLAATRLLGDWNFKAIFSQAFRAPSIENIRLNPAIKPEKAESTELEAGRKVSDCLYLSGSLAHTMVRRPIIFNTSGGSEMYSNYSRTGTYSAGLAAKYKLGAARAELGWLYQESAHNMVDIYSVPGRGTRQLGFPRHKLTLNSSIPLREGLSLNPTAVYTGKRYGYGGDGGLRVFGESVQANLHLHARDLAARGLSLGLGVRDLFDSGFSYLQPYDGGHAPLPAASREIYLKAAYEF